MADLHLWIVGVLDRQSGRYLLRRPAAAKARLVRGQKPRGLGELAPLRARQAGAGAPFGGQGPVAAPAARALDLARDRRRRGSQIAGDRPRRARKSAPEQVDRLSHQPTLEATLSGRSLPKTLW